MALSSAQQKYLFLDSSVVLAQLTNQHKELISKWKNDLDQYNLKCTVSSSVSQECEEKIRDLTDYIGNILGNLIKHEISNQRANEKRSQDEPITDMDMFAVERAFLMAHPTYSAMAKSFTKRPILNLKLIEILIVDFLDRESRAESPLGFPEVMIKLNSLILKEISNINLKLDLAIKIKSELATIIDLKPEPQANAQLLVIGLDNKDAIHVASVKQAEKDGHCAKAVFVTMDYKTILKYKTEILNKIQIRCTDPLYALYYAKA